MTESHDVLGLSTQPEAEKTGPAESETAEPAEPNSEDQMAQADLGTVEPEETALITVAETNSAELLQDGSTAVSDQEESARPVEEVVAVGSDAELSELVDAAKKDPPRRKSQNTALFRMWNTVRTFPYVSFLRFCFLLSPCSHSILSLPNLPL